MATYASVASAFDRLAPRYEELIEGNPIHRYLRVRSLAWLDQAFRPGMDVLDIGCGVGTEAVHLARRGVRVLATDISPGMVEVARIRAEREGVGDLVRVGRVAAGDLSRVLAGRSFDGAYASFGALNCEPNLARAVEEVAGLLKPGANFLLSVVSRPCLPEMVLAGMRFRVGKAFRRMADETEVHLLDSGAVHARAYSETDLLNALRPWFTIERIEGWLLVVPPPYASAAWSRLGPLKRPLMQLDERIGRIRPFRSWGDHLHVWVRRRPS